MKELNTSYNKTIIKTGSKSDTAEKLKYNITRLQHKFSQINI